VRSNASSISSASELPLLFSPANIDRSVCSVREFASVKDLLRRWSTCDLPRSMMYLTNINGPGVQQLEVDHPPPEAVSDSLNLILESGKHRATDIKYFSSPFYFTNLDVVTTTGILAHGHVAKRCTAAADPAGLGVEKVGRCLEALMRLPAAVIASVYQRECDKSDLLRLPRETVNATTVIRALTVALFGPSAPLEDPDVLTASTPRNKEPTNYDRFHKGTTLALKTLYLAAGGTSSLAGNLGSSGMPVLGSIDCMFQTLRRYAVGTDGELLLERDAASSAVAEFAAVLLWLGLLPKPKSARDMDEKMVRLASLFGQAPFCFCSAVTRRSLVTLEFRAFRRMSEETVTIPRISRKYGTLNLAIRGLMRANLMPRNMAAFSQASFDADTQMFAARTIIFDTDRLMSRSDGHEHLVGCHSPQSPHSLSSPAQRPAALYLQLAAKLLISRAGDSVDLKKVFQRARECRSLVGISIHFGNAAVEDWETLIEPGDIVEIGTTGYHVVEVIFPSQQADDVDNTGSLLDLVAVDDPNKTDLVIDLQPLGQRNADSGSDSMCDEVVNPELIDVTTPLWLRKRATPIFVQNKGSDYRFNESLPILSPEGIAVAEASVTSHMTQLQEKRLRATESLRQMSQNSGHHADTFADQKSHKQLLDTLQQFYFLGVLISLAVTHDQPIRVKLPILLFRVLKSYRPSSAPAFDQHAHDDFDPTSSSFTRSPVEGGPPALPTFACHFIPTLEDLKEKGADASVERVELVRKMDYNDFDDLLERERLPPDTTKETYIRDVIIAPNVLTPSLRVYIDATFIALADSGLNRSVTWQLSSPEELRDMCCGTT
jgi:hypothetical protein